MQFLSEKGPIEKDSRELIAGASVLGSDRDAVEIRRPTPEALAILGAVKVFQFRLNNSLGRMRKAFAATDSHQKSIEPELGNNPEIT